MKVVDRINELLKEKQLSKKDLAKKLIDLGMKANKTGEIPTISSIYAYLNGNIDIKADMIPYIADALGICEQEIFSDNNQAIKLLAKLQFKLNQQEQSRYVNKNIIELLDYLPPKTIVLLENLLLENKSKTEQILLTIK